MHVFVQKHLSFMTNIAIFASGNGSNAENIAEYFSNNETIKVKLIVSNRLNAFVHERAKRLNIPSVTFNKEDFSAVWGVLEKLREYDINFIVLAGFLLKVPQEIINAFPYCIVNIHPALLPKYGGKGMYGDNVHLAVKNGGDKKSGITIHYINENYDEGDIIFQTTCDVKPEDLPETIAKNVHELEYEYYPKVIESIINSTESNK